MYSTWFELNNASNSRKSLCSLSTGLPVPRDEIQRPIKALLRCHRRQFFPVGLRRVIVRLEDSDHTFHGWKLLSGGPRRTYTLCVDNSKLVSEFDTPLMVRMPRSASSNVSRLSVATSATMSHRPLVVCNARTSG